MLMSRITHAPINLYFDITPIRRIRSVANGNLGNEQAALLKIVSRVIKESYKIILIVILTASQLP